MAKPLKRTPLLNSRRAALPGVTAQPLAAYGAALLVPTYTGPLYRLSRHSDAAVLDIYPLANGRPNLNNVGGWIGASYTTVSIVYDQTGNGLHATQMTESLCPGFSLTQAQNAICPFVSGSNGTSTQNTQTKLNLPAGLATNRNNVTVAAVIGTGGLVTNGTLWNLGTDSSNIANSLSAGIGTSGGGSSGASFGGLALLGNTGFLFAPQPFAFQPCPVIVQSGSSALKARVGGVSTSYTAFTTLAMTGGTIGQGIWPGSSYNGALIYAVVVYNTALSDGDCTNVENTFDQIFGIPRAPAALGIWDGDSITSGFLYAIQGHGLVQQTLAGLKRPVQSINLGINGQQMSTMYTNRTNVSAKYSGSYAKSFVHLFAGTNDINNAASGSIVGVGSTTWTSYMLPYIQAQTTAGFPVFVGTTIPRNWGGSGTDVGQKETERQSLNSLITSNATTYAYTAINYGGISQFTTGGTNNPANTAYLIDGTHPSEAGYALMAALAVPAINASL